MSLLYSTDEKGLLLVRWYAYEWIHYTGDSEIQHEPYEFLYLYGKYKCWGKGVK
ncbi:hypothetical protein [Bacillus phage vB_BanS-Thrax3]|nr:hypothetical protein [Bacillus phage vB_BanS-Thrax1]UUV46473.1 hypothetical protein [Bacillus phage vB_BanS-Thrax3]